MNSRCVDTDPKLPTHVQASIAERDIRNFAEACTKIHESFGDINHELFILDDLTVYVNIANYNKRIKVFYQRLLANGKPKKLALVAAMRKLLTIINTLIKRNELWVEPTAV